MPRFTAAALGKLELVRGDITHQATDAIVNAANSGLRGGGGVDGAIHRAGGQSILEECRKIGGCPTGGAVLTTGGRLKARFVIHAVGPVYQGGKSGELELLASAYRNSLRIAKEQGLASVAFPSISTGIYGYPIKEAAEIALASVLEELETPGSPSLVRFVLFDEGTLALYRQTLNELAESRSG
jgi:O-acetyl-ADP-ribose deacetylase (regulator of RNase III)